MELYQVRYFLSVAEHLNFTRAAERLHVAQPSLTRAVQKLEEELGGPLFRRERANTHLTELGRMMLPHLQASLAAAEAAKKQAVSFRKREAGQLSVGACSTVAAELGAPLLAATAAEIAGLELQIEIAPADRLEERLMAGELDTAFLTPLPAEAGQPPPDRFDFRAFVEDAFVVAFSPGHRFEHVEEITLEDLDGEALIIRLGCGHETAIAAAMEARGVSRLVRHRSGDERWLAEMVRAGRLHFVARGRGASPMPSLPTPRRPTADLPGRPHHSGWAAPLASAHGPPAARRPGGCSSPHARDRHHRESGRTHVLGCVR
jgi:DNA-binding transcriptional LysR family regulator